MQTYGGGLGAQGIFHSRVRLWHTWFDRPLGFAGKVVLRDSEGKLSERLVRVTEPAWGPVTFDVTFGDRPWGVEVT